MSADQSSEPNVPSSSDQDTPLIASCHCKRVQIKLPFKPTELNECRCTVCYKYGAIWAYFPRSDVTVTVAEDTKLEKYIREDMSGDISFNRCGFCGCMMDWLGENKFAGQDHKMGVNCRLVSESEIQGINRVIKYHYN